MSLLNKLVFFTTVLVLPFSYTACDKDNSESGGLPPDYVDPDEENPDDDSELPPVTDVDYKYVYPQVDSDGRIIVSARPPVYTDTATMHVVSVAYDIATGTSFDISAYYADAVGKKGDELKDAIAQIITDDYEYISYGDLRYKINIADQDPENEDNVWLFYTELSVSGTWDSGQSWNREHVWAKSRGLGTTTNSTKSLASDFHNLKAEDPDVNSSKSNRDFETYVNEGDDEDFAGTHGTYSYSPKKSARGDVARMMFYMQLRWSASDGLVLDDNSENSPSYDSSYKRQGRLSHLLQWHQLDPVDPFEVRRNNVVFQYQKNRNPFVDHPELADFIYGTRQDEVWDGGVTFTGN